MWLNRPFSFLSVAVMLYLVQLTADHLQSEIQPSSSLVDTVQLAAVEVSDITQLRHDMSRVSSVYPNAFAVVNDVKLSGSGSQLRQNVETTGTFSQSIEITPASDLDTDTQSVSVSGTLVDADGFPIVGELVYLSSDFMQIHQSTLTDSRGAFAFRGVRPAENYRLAVTPATRYRKQSVDPFVVGESPEPVNLILETIPVGSVSGSVETALGIPVEHMSLVVYGSVAGLPSSKLETNVNGWFLAENVPAGRVTFAVKSPAYVPIHTMLLSPDDFAYTQIVLDPQWNSLNGRISDSSGTALGGIKVYLVLIGDPQVNAVEWQVRTNTDGTYSFCIPLPPPYELRVQATGFRRFAKTIETTDDYISVFLDANI